MSRAKVRHRGCSLPLQRVVTDFGADVAFAQVEDKLVEHYGILLAPSTIRRVTEAHAQAIFAATPVDETFKVGFDIDHSITGFAEIRDNFLKELLEHKKVEPQKLASIFDKNNFTLETKRNNSVMLEGLCEEKFQSAKNINAGNTQRELDQANIMQIADEYIDDLKEIDAARKRLRQVFDTISKFEDSTIKNQLLESLSELESNLGDFM